MLTKWGFMSRKIRVGVLFGGKSAEHEISLQSAKSIIDALDRDKYEAVLIGIDKSGEWHLRDADQYLLNADDPKEILLDQSRAAVALIPKEDGKHLVSLSKIGEAQSVDLVFPVLHGPNGEDGTVQGLLKLAGIPFVGSGVLGSAIGMDKDVMKRLLRDAGVPIAKFLVCTMGQEIDFQEIKEKLGVPFFVKPANLGSSVGISKVRSEEEFDEALCHAFEYDHKILIEEFIEGREIECSVLGNEAPIASLPGEVIPQHEFYSYEAKYLDANGAHFQIPVSLPSDLTEKIQDLAIKAYKTLCCEGMARVDFFLKKNGDLFVNELNTIPGFTKISMYPKLWEASGLPFAQLIDCLIELALQRFEKEQRRRDALPEISRRDRSR
jgi:D-alanine-D-alanine ligase